MAVGLGGKGFLPGRDADWGAGFYTIGMSDEGLLVRLPVDDELSGQVYILRHRRIAPSIHITLDAQVINSALARNDTTWAFGAARTWTFVLPCGWPQ